MTKKFACFSKVGVVLSLLLVATVQSLPVEELEEEILQRVDASTPLPDTESSTTTEEPSLGWGSTEEPSGDTASFGQTIIVEGLAGSNVNNNPSHLEAVALDGEVMTLNMTNNQIAEVQFQTDSWAVGGGEASVGPAQAFVDGPYNSLNQGSTYNLSLSFTGASSGGIINNPQTNASVSAGVIVLSSTGQVSNGTNVNPNANSNGWGWNAQGNGWRVEQPATNSSGWSAEGSGWGWGSSATQEGATASATSVESIGHVSQQSTSQDNITGIAYGNGVDPLSLNLTISAPVAVEGGVDGNGVNVQANNATAETQWQNIDWYSLPENNSTMSVNNAEVISVSAQPSSSTTISFANITVSDFATATSGNSLVNQNGGWGQHGWGIPAKS